MKIKNIILAGHMFRGYIDSVSYAFSNLSINTKTVGYNSVWMGYNIIPPLHSYIKKEFMKKEREVFIRNIISASSDSDLIMFFRADDILTASDINYIRVKTGIPIVIWLMDSFHTLKSGLDHCMEMDIVYCYNNEEANYLISKGKNAYSTPLAFDSRYYYKCDHINKDLDIYYVGSLGKRVQLLDELFGQLSAMNLKIRLDGKVSPQVLKYKMQLQNKYKYFFKYYAGNSVSHRQINAISNRSKICLNLQPSQATSGFNIRTFEICGSGGFQITNGNLEILQSIFDVGKDVQYYNDLKELVYLVKYYLKASADKERNRIRINGFEKVKRNHSFIARCQEILQYSETIL